MTELEIESLFDRLYTTNSYSEAAAYNSGVSDTVAVLMDYLDEHGKIELDTETKV